MIRVRNVQCDVHQPFITQRAFTMDPNQLACSQVLWLLERPLNFSQHYLATTRSPHHSAHDALLHRWLGTVAFGLQWIVSVTKPRHLQQRTNLGEAKNPPPPSSTSLEEIGGGEGTGSGGGGATSAIGGGSDESKRK